METTIEISALKLYGRHGVADQERTVGNTFSYDITLRYPFMRGAETDDLNATINYAEVVEIVKRVNATPSLLLENVALRIVEALTERFADITGGKVSVKKLTPPIAGCEVDHVAVAIAW